MNKLQSVIDRISNREIEFRAWDKKNKIMYTAPYPYEIAVGVEFCGFQGEQTHGEFISRHDNELIPMQYTGIKDCNGQKIFEGDIIKFIHSDNDDVTTNRLVVWNDDNTSFCLSLDGYLNHFGLPSTWNHRYEIVGNVFKNPEILQKNETPI